MQRAGGNNSAIIVARLLGTEGFTDHTAAQVERYWKRRSGLTQRQKRQIAALEKELGEMACKMTAAERMVLGRFIGLRCKMSFDVGLKIGMTAFAKQNDKNIESDGVAAGYKIE